VKEQCLLAAAIEHEGIAPLEARDHLPLARFFGQQIADGFLRHRLRRSGAHIDHFCSRPRMPQKPLVDKAIVQHDIGTAETFEAASGDETRVTRTGANQEHLGPSHG
jgi:hypothetical protein